MEIKAVMVSDMIFFGSLSEVSAYKIFVSSVKILEMLICCG